MRAGEPIQVGHPSLRPKRWPETVRRHRTDTRARLEKRLDAYLDLIAVLEPERQERTETLSRAPGDDARTPDGYQVG